MSFDQTGDEFGPLITLCLFIYLLSVREVRRIQSYLDYEYLYPQ